MDDKITLVQPVAVSACFEMLQQGKVDAVVLNEFTGRTAIKEMGLKDQIIAVQARPISITGLHVLIHKIQPERGCAVGDRELWSATDQGHRPVSANRRHTYVDNLGQLLG